jgi:hypothetical protein
MTILEWKLERMEWYGMDSSGSGLEKMEDSS